ncbi:MAG: DUF2513 domain-containing protein [Bacillus sp. (in: Bacteria)]|nr:DUF2513 domain-containing protein [Bacillus sp. (in: firmicutes)]
MKRDMELVRKILIAIEDSNKDPHDTLELSLDEYEDLFVYYHIKLLYEAGLIDAMDASSMDGTEWYAKSLTWDGHEFLDSIRNDNVWNEVRKHVKEKGGSIPLEVLKALAVKISTKYFLGDL